jgi:hypothetical protein
MGWMINANGTTKMPRLTLGEVFDKNRNLKTNEEKTAWLRKNAGPGVYYILKLVFNKPKWLLPEGAPPYKQDPGSTGLTPSHLMRELKIVYIFLEGGNPRLTQLRREQLFQQVLERLDKTENELILAIKEGTFPMRFKISKKLVEDTFPGLLETPMSVKFLRN